MKTTKLFLLAATFVLLAGLYAGAMAQDRMDPTDSIVRLPPPEPIVPIVSVTAIEISDGTLGRLTNPVGIVDSNAAITWDTAFGYTFLGQTIGSFPGSLTLSMNCTPAVPMPGLTSQLAGGVWTLPVYPTPIDGGDSALTPTPIYRGGNAGSLYGTITEGSMYWDRTGTNANVYLLLSVDGGTQTWNGVSGYATFAGTMSIDEKSQKTTLTGDMEFNITLSPKVEY